MKWRVTFCLVVAMVVAMVVRCCCRLDGLTEVYLNGRWSACLVTREWWADRAGRRGRSPGQVRDRRKQQRGAAKLGARATDAKLYLPYCMSRGAAVVPPG